MREAQTMLELLEILFKKGFTEDFKVHNGGLKALPKNILLDPKDLLVHDSFRFEGETDLDEELIIFALECTKNALKGTYVVAFGPKMDALDQKIVQELKKKLGT
jgi:hypothetical protein